MSGSGASVGYSRGSYGSLKSLPHLGSTGAFGSIHTSKSGWQHAAAAVGLSGIKSSQRLVLGMCFLVIAGCLLSSLSVLRFGQSGNNSSWMMHREPTLKLMVASKPHSGQQAAGLTTTQQQQDPRVIGRIPVQQQQPVLLQQQQGTAGVGGGAPGSSLQPASGQGSSPPHDYKQQYLGKAGRRHTRPAARQQQQQQQATQAEQKQASHTAAAYDADVQTVHEQQELQLPQSLQEKLLKQQVALLPKSGTAASLGKAASGLLQALLLTGDASQPHDQTQQHTSNDASAASAELHSSQIQQAGLTEADVAAAMAAAAGTVHAGLDPVDTTSVYVMQRGVAPARLKYPLWWHGPMWSGSGYGGEAINYVLSLVRSGRLAPADVWAYHHGDNYREHVVNTMAPEDRVELEYLQSLPVKYRAKRAAVVVCHSVPTNWAFPEPMYVTGAPCPPNPREFGWVYLVGRTMFETDRLPALFVPRLNAMNEIWVPSKWQKESFAASGVAADKLVVVPEGVNTTLFDPAAYTPLTLEDKAQLVFGKPWADKQQQGQQLATSSSSSSAGFYSDANPSDSGITGKQRRIASSYTAASASSSSGTGGSSSSDSRPRKPFVFISAFKWEMRKGWDVLLQAYLSEFTAEDDVELYILTQPFGDSGSGFKEKMHSWADKMRQGETGGKDGGSDRPSTADSSMALVQAAASGRFPSLVPALAVTQASPALVLPGTQADKMGPARRLQGQHTVLAQQQQPPPPPQQQQQQQEQEQEQEQEHGFAALHCSSPSGFANCSAADAAARLAAASSHDELRRVDAAYGGTSVGGDVEAQSKAYANHITQQIRQFTWRNMTAPALQQQRRRLLQDSQPAEAAAAAQLTAAGAQLARAQHRQQQQAGQQQDADPAADAAAAAARYPTLYVVDSHISDADFPRFYKAGDAVVLPTRGEGWGRPQVEAMAMGLPVISTNWSGITAYLDESVGYPIAVDELVPVEGGAEVIWWFKGLKWAQPSVQHLRQLMRRVYTDREEAAAKGAAARARMVERYSPDAIANVLVKELKRIEAAVP